MSNPNELSTKRFRKNMITLVVVGIVLVAVVYFGKRYKTSQKAAEVTEFYNQFSDKTYTDFAKKLEESIHTENPEIFDNSIDIASLFDFSKRELTQSYNKRKGIELLQPYLKIGSSISSQLVHTNDFKYTNFYKENGVPHIVFRVYRPDFINFIDFTLGIKKDKILITNMYNFYSGILFSEMASDMYYEAINLRVNDIANMKAYHPIRNHLYAGNYEKAYTQLASIPAAKRNPFHYQFLLIAASNYDDDKLLEVIAEMKALKPDDKRLHAYLNFQEEIVHGDIDKLNAAIDDLKKYVGEDPIFDLYRGIMFNLQSDFEKSEPFFERITTQIPDFFDGYYYKLYCLLSQDKKDEALSLIAKIKERFLISEEEFTLELQEDYKEFTDSEAYKNIFKDAE
mgnify:CR=1 FL=1